MIALYINILSASCISLIASLTSSFNYSESYAKITALSAKLIFALNKPSDVNGDPLIYNTFGKRLIYSHNFGSISGDRITTNYNSFK